MIDEELSKQGFDQYGRTESLATEKAPNAVSWFRPHLETSLELIGRLGPGRQESIIDVGGGESTLVDDLLARGYENITVLDISQTAFDANKQRLGKASDLMHWLAADITKIGLESSAYDVWHDRAVFHFLNAEADRVAYVRQVARGIRRGGHVIISTFGPEGRQ
jgi:SAM-dependent methyltransferase